MDSDPNAARNTLIFGLRGRACGCPTLNLKRSKQAGSMKQEAFSR